MLVDQGDLNEARAMFQRTLSLYEAKPWPHPSQRGHGIAQSGRRAAPTRGARQGQCPLEAGARHQEDKRGAAHSNTVNNKADTRPLGRPRKGVQRVRRARCQVDVVRQVQS